MILVMIQALMLSTAQPRKKRVGIVREALCLRSFTAEGVGRFSMKPMLMYCSVEGVWGDVGNLAPDKSACSSFFTS